ncbi:MAG: hypothetical protein LC748_11635, partial [Thermomicrobia bacterium]|nr:hypothetical protein [Thermomicrobia bacterium]
GQIARKIVSMREDGRMTVSRSCSQGTPYRGETDFACGVTDGGLFPRPILTIPPEDTWAYMPEESATIEGIRHSPIGPGVREEDLEAINASDDPEQAARDLITRLLGARVYESYPHD